MKKIAILGSTGSIGTQTLDIARANRDLKITALSAHKNITLLEQETREFLPELVCVYDEQAAQDFRIRVRDLSVRVVSGMEGLIEAAAGTDAEVVVGAVVGMIGIQPVMEAIRTGKDIALANKETLVCAGHLIMPMLQEYGVRILPVDSEHSAIFQCLAGEAGNRIAKILLTASGGPFRMKRKEELAQVTVEDALKHPNWSMGAKITIDSASMVNKALEVMEAHWLFDVPIPDIQVVIQPKSVIHSMVEFVDGAIKAQLGTPDMHLPIQYALYYPERRFLSGDRLDFTTLREISFEQPDPEKFEGLKLGIDAGIRGGNAPTVFNAANEYAVSKFLSGKISFMDIPRLLKYALSEVQLKEAPSLKDILDTEKETVEVLNCLQQ